MAQYRDKDCIERDALVNRLTAREKGVTRCDILWEQGYRHGDHVLVYASTSGFAERVLTRFHGKLELTFPFNVNELEEALGYSVKPEDRTQRKSQPDLSSHVTGMLIPKRVPRWYP